MKTSTLCFAILLGLLLLTLSVDAWWIRRSGSSRSTPSRTARTPSSTGSRFRWNRFADKAKEKAKSATDFVKNKYNAAKDFVGEKVEYGKDYLGGAKDMWKNYNDMKDANTKGADKYFHAKGNYEAAARGPGGAKAAEHISNLREDAQLIQGVLTGKSKDEMFSDYKADQEANEHGRNGGDPNKYRPEGLDDEYKK